MNIEQCRPSTYMTLLGERFMQRYHLAPYTDPHKPAIFFGCYLVAEKGREVRIDIDAVLRHRALAVIVWCGSDSMRLSAAPFAPLLRDKKVRHIAKSLFIVKDLNAVGAAHVNLPLCASLLERFTPVPKGPCLYSYLNHSNPELYGAQHLPQISAAFPDIEIITGHSKPPNHFSYEDMPGVYARCFMGLRLTSHDGFPNTVVEMGMMGRKCVWNAYMPNTVPWRNVADVIETIRAERQHIGETDSELAAKVKAYMDIGTAWLTTEFYER